MIVKESNPAHSEDPVFERSYGEYVTFSYVPLRNHAIEILKRPWCVVWHTLSSLGIAWLIWSIVAAFQGWQTIAAIPLATIVAASLACGIAISVYYYINEAPAGLGQVNKRARRLAHLRPLKWEYRMAQSLLAERISPLNQELQQMTSGSLFIEGRRCPNLASYLEWLETRANNLQRLVAVFTEVMIEQLPRAVCSTSKMEAEPLRILNAVDAVARVYEDTINLERDARAVIPPEGWERLHEIQLRWTDPFRKAIVEQFDNLQRIIDVDPEDDAHISLVVELGELPHSEEFGIEMDRLHRQVFGG
jgi:hypothetical protein